MKYLLLLLTIIFLVHLDLQGRSKVRRNKFRTLCYEIQNGDTLSKILKKIVINKKYRQKNRKKIISKIKRNNKKIKNWNNLEVGKRIYIPNLKRKRSKYRRKSNCSKKYVTKPILKTISPPIPKPTSISPTAQYPNKFDFASNQGPIYVLNLQDGKQLGMASASRKPASEPTAFSLETKDENIVSYKDDKSTYFDFSTGPGYSTLMIKQTGDFGAMESETYAFSTNFNASFYQDDFDVDLDIVLYKANFGKVVQSSTDYSSTRIYNTSLSAGYKGFSFGGSLKKIPYAKITSDTAEINFSTMDQHSLFLGYEYNNFSFFELDKSFTFKLSAKAGRPIHVGSSKHLNTVESFSGYNFALIAGGSKFLNSKSRHSWALTLGGDLFYSYNKLTVKGEWDQTKWNSMVGKSTIVYHEMGAILKLSFLF